MIKVLGALAGAALIGVLVLAGVPKWVVALAAALIAAAIGAEKLARKILSSRLTDRGGNS